MTNVPAIVEHLEGAQQFLVNEQTDNVNVGAYTITIHNEISVPDDATKASHTTFTVHYDMKILIQPCAVTNYTASLKVVDIS